MSGGSGGIIIINLAQSPGVSTQDRAELVNIADRSPIRCSRLDALRVLRILWKYLRP